MYTTKKNFAFNPDKIFAFLSNQFHKDEQVEALFTLSGNGAGYGIVSKLRFAFFKAGQAQPFIDVPIDQIEKLESTSKLGTKIYSLVLKDGTSVKIGAFLRDDEEPVVEIINFCMTNAESTEGLTLDTPASRDAEFSKIEANFPWVKVPKHLQKNVLANISASEKPLFIISSNAGSAAGALVAMKDRCILIKSGALGGLMSGTLGGARVSSFYYKDITGIEYNSGLVTGVVELLTASYNGSANKDFWKGTNKGRNSDSNDPWVLSNTLPLSKIDYASAKTQFDKLRKLISESKNPNNVSVTLTSPTNSMSDEIEKLANLLQQGIIDENEFKEAKKKILGL